MPFNIRALLLTLQSFICYLCSSRLELRSYFFFTFSKRNVVSGFCLGTFTYGVFIEQREVHNIFFERLKLCENVANLFVLDLFVRDFKLISIKVVLLVIIVQANLYITLQILKLGVVKHVKTGIIERKCVYFVGNWLAIFFFNLLFEVFNLLLGLIKAFFIYDPPAWSSRTEHVGGLILGLKGEWLGQGRSVTYKLHSNLIHRFL